MAGAPSCARTTGNSVPDKPRTVRTASEQPDGVRLRILMSVVSTQGPGIGRGGDSGSNCGSAQVAYPNADSRSTSDWKPACGSSSRQRLPVSTVVAAVDHVIAGTREFETEFSRHRRRFGCATPTPIPISPPLTRRPSSSRLYQNPQPDPLRILPATRIGSWR